MSLSKIETRVKTLLEQSIVIDGHSDILIPLTEGKMDISNRVEIPPLNGWQAPPGMDNSPLVDFGFNPHTIYFGCMGQYDIPRWKEGGINSQLCAIYLGDDKLDAPFKKGMEMVYTFHKMITDNEELVLCTSVQNIRQAKLNGKIACILSFEGCEALGRDIRMLDMYHQLGLKVVSLTHTKRNIFSEGCWGAKKQGGLTPLGVKLVERLQALDIVIDLVHIGKHAFFEVLELANKPVILSHSTPTMFGSSLKEDLVLGGAIARPRLELPRDRKMLKALANNGGVLGLIWILYKDINAAVDDIETALNVMGPNHIGLGSDLYGHQFATPGLEDISKLPNLLKALIKRGHSDDTLQKFLGGNYLRVFQEVWGT